MQSSLAALLFLPSVTRFRFVSAVSVLVFYCTTAVETTSTPPFNISSPGENSYLTFYDDVQPKLPPKQKFRRQTSGPLCDASEKLDHVAHEVFDEIRTETFEIFGHGDGDVIELQIRSNVATNFEIRDWVRSLPPARQSFMAEVPESVGVDRRQPMSGSQPPTMSSKSTVRMQAAYVEVEIQQRRARENEWNHANEDDDVTDQLTGGQHPEPSETLWAVPGVVVNYTSFRFETPPDWSSVFGRGTTARYVTVVTIQLDYNDLSDRGSDDMVNGRLVATKKYQWTDTTSWSRIAAVTGSVVIVLFGIPTILLSVMCLRQRAVCIYCQRGQLQSVPLGGECVGAAVAADEQIDQTAFIDHSAINTRYCRPPTIPHRQPTLANHSQGVGSNETTPSYNYCPRNTSVLSDRDQIYDIRHSQTGARFGRSQEREYEIFVVGAGGSTASEFAAAAAASGDDRDETTESSEATTTHTRCCRHTTSCHLISLVAAIVGAICCACALLGGALLLGASSPGVGANTKPCLQQSTPPVHVTVFIPTSGNAMLDSMKIFMNGHLANSVNDDRWTRSSDSASRFLTFNLDDASLTTQLPCFEQFVCQTAASQHLAGCNPATGQCVCQSGYQLDGDICIDVDECNVDPGHVIKPCPINTECFNVIGGFECRCPAGFFAEGDDVTETSPCQECGAACPPGMFESSPCSFNSDRVCTACGRCDEFSVEVCPCTATSDRQCIYVAHPQLTANKAAEASLVEGLKMHASPNVIVEDLHRTRNLETTYYVTDTTQASDFYWDRESGIRVNIGIHDVQLIADYVDVDHTDRDDNQFILGKRVDSDDRNKFQRVVDQFCRHPVPDYYSLTLEISRNRTTAAHYVSCDRSSVLSSSVCPPQYADGDQYLDRSINEACIRKMTPVEQLTGAANSIVCVDDSQHPPVGQLKGTQKTSLFSLFGETDFFSDRRHVTELRFPSNRCKSATEQCNSCLESQRCMTPDISDRQCCQLDCLSTSVCKEAYSRACRSPVECATGDVHRYTLQPVYRNDGTYRCHVRNSRSPSLKATNHVTPSDPLTSSALSSPPSVLYELFIYAQVPRAEFRTTAVHRTIPLGDLSHQRRGTHLVDYLTVEHDAGLDLHEEFVLVSPPPGGNQFFKLLPVGGAVTSSFATTPTAMSTLLSGANTMASRDLRVLPAVQFEEPFDYSSSTWGRQMMTSLEGHQQPASWCGAGHNVSRFRSPGIDSDVTLLTSRDVQRNISAFVTPNIVDGSFHYFLQNVESPPHFRFTVPGNASILPFYFQDGPRLLVDNSLKVFLAAISPNVWLIDVIGKLTDCPGYVSVAVRRHSFISTDPVIELARADLLILCPLEFNVSLHIPDEDFDSDTVNNNHLWSRTFEIDIGDWRGIQIYDFRTFAEKSRRESVAAEFNTSPQLQAIPPRSVFWVNTQRYRVPEADENSRPLDVNITGGDNFDSYLARVSIGIEDDSVELAAADEQFSQSTTSTDTGDTSRREQLLSTWSPATVVLLTTVSTSTLIIGFMAAARHCYIWMSRRRIPESRDPGEENEHSNSCGRYAAVSKHRRQLSPRPAQCQTPSLIVTVYVIFRLLYSVFLTLSVILPVTSLIIRFRPEVVHLLTYCYRRPCLGHVALKAVEEMAEVEMALWEDDCMQKQRIQVVLESCDRHVAQLVQRVDDVISSTTFQQKLRSANVIGKVTQEVANFTEQYLSSYTKTVANFVAAYRKKLELLELLIARRNRRVTKVLEGAWLTFPRLLSNASATRARFVSSHSVWLNANAEPKKVVDPLMTRLLAVDDTDNAIEVWIEMFWSRFNSSFPSIEFVDQISRSRPAIDLTPFHQPCLNDECPESVGDINVATCDGHQTSDRSQFDSARFFAARDAVGDDPFPSCSDLAPCSDDNTPGSDQTFDFNNEKQQRCGLPAAGSVEKQYVEKYRTTPEIDGVFAHLVGLVWNVVAVVDVLLLWRRLIKTCINIKILKQSNSNCTLKAATKNVFDEPEVQEEMMVSLRSPSPNRNAQQHQCKCRPEIVGPSSGHTQYSCRCQRSVTASLLNGCSATSSSSTTSRHHQVTERVVVDRPFNHTQQQLNRRRRASGNSVGELGLFHGMVRLFSGVTIPRATVVTGSACLLLAACGVVSFGLIHFLSPMTNVVKLSPTAINASGSESLNDASSIHSGHAVFTGDVIDSSVVQLKSLQSIIDSFNAALQRYADYTNVELCLVTSSSPWTCNYHEERIKEVVSIDDFHLIMLPCNNLHFGVQHSLDGLSSRMVYDAVGYFYRGFVDRFVSVIHHVTSTLVGVAAVCLMTVFLSRIGQHIFFGYLHAKNTTSSGFSFASFSAPSLSSCFRSVKQTEDKPIDSRWPESWQADAESNCCGTSPNKYVPNVVSASRQTPCTNYSETKV